MGSESGQNLPYCTEGVVVKGFGRGSKQLGFPTANYSVEVVEKLPKVVESGVYYGFAQVDGGAIHKMVMSIGWNPFYKNTVKSMETHILHKFEEDFYGKVMKIVIVGYLRPEKNFGSLEELICAIKNDIDQAEKLLSEDRFASYRTLIT